MRRLLVLGVLVVLVAAGCSDSGGSDAGKDAVTTVVTTTVPEISDDEIVATIDEQVRPALEGEYDAETVDCLVELLQDAGTGDVSGDELLEQYEDRCDVSMAEVAGVMGEADLLANGVDAAAAACFREQVSAIDISDAEALESVTLSDAYETCGIDPEVGGR